MDDFTDECGCVPMKPPGRSPIRVACIVSHLGATGPNRQLLNLVKYLPKSQFKPAVLTLSPSKGVDLSTEFRDNGIPIYLALAGGARVPYRLGRLFGRVRSLDPHIVHTQGIRGDLLSAFFLKERVRVSTLRCDPRVDYGYRLGRRLGALVGGLHLMALARLDAPVACSIPLKDAVSGEFENGLKAIRNGVDTEAFQKPTHDQKKAARVRLGLPGDKRILIFTGDLIPLKDPGLLLKAVASLPAFGDYHLVLVGDGPLLESCRSLARALGVGLSLPGRVKDVKDYLAAGDYYVSASHSEGLPNSVVEALAMGLPVCLSDIPSHAEILKSAPDAGVLFARGNPEASAFSLETLLGRAWTDASDAARGLAAEVYGAKRMAEEYANHYREALALNSETAKR